MAYKFGWFSTGRDPAARELLTMVHDNIKSGFIPGEIAFVFCNREKGESEESDAFISLVEDYGLELICFSSRMFKPELREEGKRDPSKRIQWRNEFDAEVYDRLKELDHDLIVLAGYMLIVSDMLCTRYDMVNLHPATPEGPKGTWQEVIWELIGTDANETGVMMHLVSPELDRGPPVAYCSFPIRGGIFDKTYSDLQEKLKVHSLSEIQESEGEDEPYFALVRAEGVKRELPIIIMTLKSFAEKKVQIETQTVFSNGKQLESGYDLTEEIEEYIKNR